MAEDKRLVITNLEKQRTELLHAFKKQMLLVDNLKKQKVRQFYLLFLSLCFFFYFVNAVSKISNLLIFSMYLKAHLEANMLINYTEEELLKLLDWKLDYA